MLDPSRRMLSKAKKGTWNVQTLRVAAVKKRWNSSACESDQCKSAMVYVPMRWAMKGFKCEGGCETAGKLLCLPMRS
jgi:hypothetical protein